MKVSTNSWHYRLIDWLDFNHCRNLCAYFWQAVLAVVLATVVFPVAGVFTLVVATMPLWHMFHWNFAITVFAIGAAFIEIIVLLFLLRTIVKDRHEEEMLAGERESLEPSLAYSWLKAKHDKICPLIEFD